MSEIPKINDYERSGGERTFSRTVREPWRVPHDRLAATEAIWEGTEDPHLFRARILGFALPNRTKKRNKVKG